MSSSGQEIRRRRGVRASRAKLIRAMTAAGLRTQAALAERIADLEGLESAPKDTVNRAFRELPVELQTIERIARALGVDAWTLYRSADEASRDGPGAAGTTAPDTPPTATDGATDGSTDAGGDATGAGPAAAGAVATSSPGTPQHRPRRLGAAVTALLALLVAIAVTWLTVNPPDDGTPAIEDRSFQRLSLGRPSLVVMPIAGDEQGALAGALRERLADDFSVADVGAGVLTRDLTPGEAATRLRADGAIDSEIVTVGRRVGLRFDLYAEGTRQQFWAESLPSVELMDSLGRIAERTATALRRAIGDDARAGGAHFPLAPVQDEYLLGWFFLDEPANELNIKRARSHFETALRQDANYARAHAGLCQALLEEHWMADEERALQDAARTCGQALQLAPDDPVVQTAHAHFLRRTGRNEEAISRYEDIVARHPHDVDALEGLASARLHAYRQHGDDAMLELAMEAARAAADSDPAVWKPLFALATMHWFAGDLNGAIAASEEAMARDRNEYVLANLGTWYVCRGDYQQARDAYLEARELAPQSYVGDEFLGLVYYLLGDYERSVTLRRRAIDAVATGEPEIHQMWGALADSYYRAGDAQNAAAAWRRAAEILERDHLRGTAPAADRAARAYYYLMLRRLEPQSVPDEVLDGVLTQLDDAAEDLNDATAYRRLAQVRLLLGERERAREALARATATCPGYADFPDLAALSELRPGDGEDLR